MLEYLIVCCITFLVQSDACTISTAAMASLGPKTATTDARENDAAVANDGEFDSDTDSHLEDGVDDQDDDEADTQPPSNAVSLLSDLSLGSDNDSDEEEEEDEDVIEEQSHGDLSILSLRVREA